MEKTTCAYRLSLPFHIIWLDVSDNFHLKVKGNKTSTLFSMTFHLILLREIIFGLVLPFIALDLSVTFADFTPAVKISVGFIRNIWIKGMFFFVIVVTFLPFFPILLGKSGKKTTKRIHTASPSVFHLHLYTA